jgi:hypothetical protein
VLIYISSPEINTQYTHRLKHVVNEHKQDVRTPQSKSVSCEPRNPNSTDLFPLIHPPLHRLPSRNPLNCLRLTIRSFILLACPKDIDLLQTQTFRFLRQLDHNGKHTCASEAELIGFPLALGVKRVTLRLGYHINILAQAALSCAMGAAYASINATSQ